MGDVRGERERENPSEAGSALSAQTDVDLEPTD